MSKSPKTHLVLIFCFLLSALIHTLSVYIWRLFITYDFTPPVISESYVAVDLVQPLNPPPPKAAPQKNKIIDSENRSSTKKTAVKASESQQFSFEEPDLPESTDKSSEYETAPPQPLIDGGKIIPAEPEKPSSPAITPNKTLLTDIGSFLQTRSEKLTYQISMLGLPVGIAELEADNLNGEIRITLRVRSNSLFSTIYPVDDLVETRHVSGRFIMTNIKQHEASFNSSQEFTINLKKRRVSSFNTTRGTSETIYVPTDEVLDTLSGFYYLRNRQLNVGESEKLHIFDSEIYAEVSVSILRRETIQLLNLRRVKTIVIQPLQKTSGIFRQTGDITIWLTDDDYKVPVKILTTVPYGAVEADIISAESEPLKVD
ncbi:MAG: DUF3108 domain-containing protein [Desulfuromonadaceae bacterium]|nr:DUF3108 domain-containing protein [Desulfuromonadaceae bacterium]MDD2855392.1 DUF3108 domain-containing protein [Desulfuromonadaceae bacterium]